MIATTIFVLTLIGFLCGAAIFTIAISAFVSGLTDKERKVAWIVCTVLALIGTSALLYSYNAMHSIQPPTPTVEPFFHNI